MSNKCIYNNNYVYLIENIENGKYYIGVRSTNLPPEYDLGNKYHSSSRDKNFKEDQKVNKHKYKYTVLKNFDNRIDAELYEAKLHNEKQIHIDPLSYNRAMNTFNGFSTVGKTPARFKNGNIEMVNVDDERLQTGELTYVTTGFFIVYDKSDKQCRIHESEFSDKEYYRIERVNKKCKDTDGNIFTIHKNSTRIKKENLKVAKHAKDSKNNKYLVFPDDPRIVNGSLCFIEKNKKIHAYDINDKKHILDVELYNSELFYTLEKNHKRCKDENGNIFTLYITHSWIKNNKVTVANFASDGLDTYLVFPDDPRIVNGSLKFIEKKKKIFVYDPNDKRHKINEDAYQTSFRNFYKLPINTKKCKDKNGNILYLHNNHASIKKNLVIVAYYATDGKDTYLVFKDDPRIVNGSLKFIEGNKTSKTITVYDKNDMRHIIDESNYDPIKFYILPKRHKKCKDENGDIRFIYRSNPLVKNNKIKIAKHAISVKDVYLVFEDDPRILNGELKFK